MSQSVEEFLAQGGKIAQIPEGERVATSREMHDMVRGEEPRAVKSDGLSTFGKLDAQTGGTLTDQQLLVMAEMKNCE